MRRTRTWLVLLVLVAGSTIIGLSRLRKPSAPPLTAEEVELFYGDLDPDGTLPMSDRVAKAIDQLSSSATQMEFQKNLRSIGRLGTDAIPYLGQELIDRFDGSPYVVDNLAEALGQMRSPESAPYLIRALDHPVQFVRIKAIQGLTKAPTPECVEPVRRFLSSDSRALREAAIQILVNVDTPESLGGLFDHVESLPLFQKLEVLEGLALAGRRDILPIVNQLRFDENPIVRLAAARCLNALGEEGGSEIIGTVLDAGDPGAKERAIEILTVDPSPDSEVILSDLALGEGDTALRSRAAMALRLGRKGPPSIFWALREDPDASIRFEANLALLELGDEKIWEVLLDQLESDDRELKTDAVQAFRYHKNSRATVPLLDALERSEESVEKRQIITALVRIGDAEAIDPILEIVRDDSLTLEDGRLLSERAMDSVANFREKAFAPILAAYESSNDVDFRRKCIQIVSRIALVETLPALGDLYRRERDPGLRFLIIHSARDLRSNSMLLSSVASEVTNRDPEQEPPPR